jgi:hypothetical protein
MLVSVCMPLFNSERYVASALDSVLDQTYPHVEIVIVDDGSTDSSSSILQNYASRVQALRQANMGAAAARNAAYRAAKGNAILFMDADDVIGPDHIQALASKLDGCLTVASSPWARFFSCTSEACFNERYISEDISGPDWLAQSWDNALPMMQPGMFLLPRALIERFGGWDERLSLIDDFEFYARIIAASDGVRFARDAGLFYRSGVPCSLSGRKSRKAIESQFLSLILGTGHLLKAEDSARTRRACANVLQSFEYEHYPNHPDLRAKIRARVADLGGADIQPSGPPGFHKLRPWIGWMAARHVQRVAERLGLNGAARAQSQRPMP